MQQELTTTPVPERTRIRWWVIIGTVAAILGVPYLILYPVFRSAKIASLRGAEEGYVRSADLALIRYMGGRGDRYPNLSGDMVSMLRPYISDPKAIEAMSRFVWNDKLSGKRENDLVDPSSQWVLYSRYPASTSYVIGMADGHLAFTSSQHLDEVLLMGRDKSSSSKSKQK
jgi:hypothetical protein